MIICIICELKNLSKFQSQTNIFSRNNTPFSVKPTVAQVNIPPKNTNFSSFKFGYHRLGNLKKPILPQVKYLKALKDMNIGTIGT